MKVELDNFIFDEPKIWVNDNIKATIRKWRIW